MTEDVRAVADLLARVRHSGSVIVRGRCLECHEAPGLVPIAIIDIMTGRWLHCRCWLPWIDRRREAGLADPDPLVLVTPPAVT
jgi:hypothetical protein